MAPGKVGLALSSGVARGLAHIGVLEVLKKESIPIDMIAGTSMGALVGAVYAGGISIKELKSTALEMAGRRLTSLVDITLPRDGLIRGRRIEDRLKSLLDNKKFSDLKIPFACVATDIDSGDEVVISEGLVWEAVRASISIPVVLNLAEWGGRYLVDGALINPVPVSVLKAMGADFIIAVNVVPHRGLQGEKKPNIFNIITHMLHIASRRVLEHSLEGADIIIEPEVAHIGAADFQHADECILRGEWAAQELIPEIKDALAAR